MIKSSFFRALMVAAGLLAAFVAADAGECGR